MTRRAGLGFQARRAFTCHLLTFRDTFSVLVPSTSTIEMMANSHGRSSAVMLKFMRKRLSRLLSMTTLLVVCKDKNDHSSATNSVSMKIDAHIESAEPCSVDSVRSLGMRRYKSNSFSFDNIVCECAWGRGGVQHCSNRERDGKGREDTNWMVSTVNRHVSAPWRGGMGARATREGEGNRRGDAG